MKIQVYNWFYCIEAALRQRWGSAEAVLRQRCSSAEAALKQRWSSSEALPQLHWREVLKHYCSSNEAAIKQHWSSANASLKQCGRTPMSSGRSVLKQHWSSAKATLKQQQSCTEAAIKLHWSSNKAALKQRQLSNEAVAKQEAGLQMAKVAKNSIDFLFSWHNSSLPCIVFCQRHRFAISCIWYICGESITCISMRMMCHGSWKCSWLFTKKDLHEHSSEFFAKSTIDQNVSGWVDDH